MRAGLSRTGAGLALSLSACFSPDPTPLGTETDAATTADASASASATSTTNPMPITDGVDATGVDTATDADSSGPTFSCDAPLLLCNAACIDPDVNPIHCGECGNSCADSTEVCASGRCVPDCEAGLTACGDACVDTRTDPSHCGGCGMPCGGGEVCNGEGSCAADCPVNTILCDRRCVDPNTDDAHCGGCGMPCSPWETCAAMACVSVCGPGQVWCDGVCVDPDDDPAHCGAGIDCAADPGVVCLPDTQCIGGACQAPQCLPFVADAVGPDLVFASVLDNQDAGIAWDGTHYWGVGGGNSIGQTAVQYDPDGLVLATYETNFDFRSVFTQGDGTPAVFARAFNSSTVLIQDSPGVFVPFVELIGAPIDNQAMVAWNPVSGEFIAFNNGTLDRWTADGAYVGNIAFAGYGELPGEEQYPQNRGVMWGNGCYLTHNNGTLSGWDPAGNRVGTIVLEGVGANFNSNFAIGWGAGRFWTSDDTSWRAFNVF